MAQVRKLEGEVQIKVGAEKFFNVLKNQNQQIPKASSDRVQTVDVLEGDWETAGSVKLWKCTLDGKVEIFKERVEIDEANNSIAFVSLGGNVLDLYDNYKLILKVTPKSEGALVKVTIQYEKRSEDFPAPNKYLNLVTNILKDLDAHLMN